MMLINGETADRIDALDRGFHYGDGVFETIAVIAGEPQLWDLHLARLQEGCRRLRLVMPAEEVLTLEAGRVCAGQARAMLKVIVTRGRSGGRPAYRVAADDRADGQRATRLLAVFPVDAYPAVYYRQGVAVRICATRLGANPALAGIKHLNRLEQVLARSEWDDDNVAEGLMLDVRGDVIEGTMTNVFAASGGVLWTPAVSEAGVAGVMRRFIIERGMGSGIDVREGRLPVERIQRADEVFLSNSLIGVWPVRRIDDVPFEPGPLTRQLMKDVASHCLMS